MKQVKNVMTLVVLLIALSARADGERVNLLFNFDWKFKLGEVQNAESPAFDDADWRRLDLPHDFQIEMPWNEKANRSRGFKDMATGWYRKTFDADKTWQGKRVMLDFEGIMLHGDAYLNGQKIGGTDYGYLGFEADITKLLKWNGKNYPVRGRICMDQCMVDIGLNSGIKRWDRAVIFGTKEDGALQDANDVANMTDTISYEVTTSVSERVPRIYTDVD